MKQEPGVHARRHVLANRINESDNPSVVLILMRKLLPGPTKIFGRCLLSGTHLCQISEARNSATNGKGPETPRTRQLARDNFNPIFFLNRFQMNRGPA